MRFDGSSRERLGEGQVLASLDDLPDHRVADQDVDPRGWLVVAGDGQSAGRVSELIVDLSASKVRYLECAVDDVLLPRGVRRRHVLIPVAFIRLDEAGERVLVDTLDSVDMSRLPEFRGLPLDPAHEPEIARAFTEGPGSSAAS